MGQKQAGANLPADIFQVLIGPRRQNIAIVPRFIPIGVPGNPETVAHTLCTQARQHLVSGDYDLATQLTHEALALLPPQSPQIPKVKELLDKISFFTR